MKSFETFLREKHAKEYVGNKDNMEEFFIQHMYNFNIDTWLKLSEEWHRLEMEDVLNDRSFGLNEKGQTNERN